MIKIANASRFSTFFFLQRQKFANGLFQRLDSADKSQGPSPVETLFEVSVILFQLINLHLRFHDVVDLSENKLKTKKLHFGPRSENIPSQMD